LGEVESKICTLLAKQNSIFYMCALDANYVNRGQAKVLPTYVCFKHG